MRNETKPIPARGSSPRVKAWIGESELRRFELGEIVRFGVRGSANRAGVNSRKRLAARRMHEKPSDRLHRRERARELRIARQWRLAR